MKTIIILVLSSILMFSSQLNKDANNDQDISEELNTDWLNDWIFAWETISNEVLKLPASEPPLMLFYDETKVYTTSLVSAPEGSQFDGPDFIGKNLKWYFQDHNDTLILPDGQQIPVQLMSFAAPLDGNEAESFFVMAAPIFWKNAGVDGRVISLEKMITGVFLHEFSHTRQMSGLGTKISTYEFEFEFEQEVTDDLIQDYYTNDTSYVNAFRKETDLFFKAALSENDEELIELTSQAISMYKSRQEIVRQRNEILVEMDDVFLSMEGTGQYVFYNWLTHPKCIGGSVNVKTAITATRRGGRWWSQDQGLALSLLYDRLSKDPDWSNLYSQKPSTLINLIQLELANIKE